MGCAVCKRIDLIKKGEYPYFVCELKTGYVVLGDHRRFYGYALFLSKEHAAELNDLPRDFRMAHLEEMSMVAEAVQTAFNADKMNYELLGNAGTLHIHWHLFPRTKEDRPVRGPAWWVPVTEMNHNCYIPTKEQLTEMSELLRNEIERLLSINVI